VTILVPSQNYRDQESNIYATGHFIRRVGLKYFLYADEGDEPKYSFSRRGLTSEKVAKQISSIIDAPLLDVEKALAKLSLEDAVKIEMKVQKRELSNRINKRALKIEVFDQPIIDKTNTLLENGSHIQFILETVHLFHAGDDEAILAELLSALSCKLCKVKIHSWMIGQSGKGKSHLKYAVVKILPNELYEVFTSASPRSLFYYVKEYGEDSLDGVLLFIDEVESAKQTLPMLRSLTSQTEITPRHLSVHEAELLDLKIKGSRTVWFTSVKPFGSEQIRNRFIFPNPDETENQDERVFELQDKLNRENHGIPEEPFKVCKKIVQKVVKETIDLEVVIPYRIEWKFKERRWLYPIFLAFIKMSAKLSFKRRAIDNEGRIIASREDFERTKHIWGEFHETITYRVPRQAIELLKATPENRSEAMTHSELAQSSSFSTRWVEKLCEDLHNEGLVNRQKRSGRGAGRLAWEYWKANVPSIEDVAIIENLGINELTKSPPESNILSSTQFDNSEIRESADNTLEQLRKLRFNPKRKVQARGCSDCIHFIENEVYKGIGIIANCKTKDNMGLSEPTIYRILKEGCNEFEFNTKTLRGEV